jgi:hypothetical protein
MRLILIAATVAAWCAVAADPHEIPPGVLAPRLGAYLAIEGVRTDEVLTAGARTLRVDTVNGKKLEKPVLIWIENVAELPENTRCILRGYESVRMIGVPKEVLKQEKRTPPQVGWQLQHYFIITSVVEPKDLDLGGPLPER